MSAEIVIPDFPFSSHFYPEILEDLINFMRSNAPELTDEDPTEPHIQLLRSFALSGHLNNVLLDMVANESFLPTAKLRASHRNLLALIAVKLKQATPATADILTTLTRKFSTGVTTVPSKSSFATLETRAASAVEYEVLEDVTTERTDQVGLVYSYDSTSDAFADHTAEAITPSGSFSPNWGTVQNNDALYIGHRSILWDKMTFAVSAVTGGVITSGVWEYFDGNFDQGNPTSVTNLGITLRFNVNSILGSADRTGTTVRVRCNATGAFQDLVVAFVAGENRITTATGPNAFLGQLVPSLIATDYTVGTDWRELHNVVDGTGNFNATGTTDVSFTLPQTLLQNWRKTTVGAGVLAVKAYWIRFRAIVTTGAVTALAIDEVKITEGEQYQVINATQGRSREDNPLGSSDGSASQEFIFTNLPVIDDANLRIFVNEAGVEREYLRVENFLNSVSTDRHFTVDFDDDGIATITFGDGVNGRIPPAGVNNIRSTYRTMDEVDGNVGADTITVNRSGIAWIGNLTNPRGATGFNFKEGSTVDDLARLKVAGPATLRIRERAVSTEDVELLVLDFIAADGSKPVKRALGIEEAFGPKTVEAVVVGAGGAQVPPDKLSEIQDFFNGVVTKRGKIVLNHEATVTNFTPYLLGVNAVVDGGNETAILTALTALLNPLFKEDGVSFLWKFGGTIPVAKIIQVIMDTVPRPRNCVVSYPATDVILGSHNLPIVGPLAITVNP